MKDFQPNKNSNSQKWKPLYDKLLSTNTLYESVFSSLQLSIIVTDSNHKVLYYTSVTPKVLELNSSQKKGYLWDFIKSSSLSSFLKQSLENNDTFKNQEFTQKKKIVSLSLSPYLQKGKLYGNVLYIKDITEEKEEKNNTEGSESLNTLIQMSSGMAHEIKNPLGALSLHGQILEKSIEKEAEKEKLLYHTHIILEEVERLSGIVNQYLFALRPLNLPLEPLSLNDIIEKTIEIIFYELTEDSIEIKLELRDNLPRVLLNNRYFKQALLNLLENSRYALKEKKSETPKTLILRTYERQDWVCLDIEDNGIGINPEFQNNFFKPYYSTKEGSSGLGMSIIFKIIQEHKGKISFRSSLNIGTVFTLSLPIYQESQSMLSFEER